MSSNQVSHLEQTERRASSVSVLIIANVLKASNRASVCHLYGSSENINQL